MPVSDKKTILFARLCNPADTSPYCQKFATLITAIDAAKKDWTESVVVCEPNILGDTYDELIESLSRLANSKIYLTILHRRRLATNIQN